MNVVGRVGSLISQGVYSVATPFHPFGGAVDIIVVQQQDGTFRSAPWYVRFGKFQGVLKGSEKIVRISVNGVEANFHMYLDNSGGAYFLREVGSGEGGGANGVPKDSGNLEGAQEDSRINDNNAVNIENGNLSEHEEGAFIGEVPLQDENVPLGVNRIQRTESDSERRFYDFQDEQSSLEGSVELSEYGYSRYENLDSLDRFVESQNLSSEVVLVSVDGHILTAPITSSERNADDLQLSTPQFHLGPGQGTEFCAGNVDFNEGEGACAADYLSDLGTSAQEVASKNSCSVKNDSNAFVLHQEVYTEGREHFCRLQENKNLAAEVRESCANSNLEVASAGRREGICESCLVIPLLGVQDGNTNRQDVDSLLGIHDKADDSQNKSLQSLQPASETGRGDFDESRSSAGLIPTKSGHLGHSVSPDLEVEVEQIAEKGSTGHMGSDDISVHSISYNEELEGQVDNALAVEECTPQGSSLEDEHGKCENLEPQTATSSDGIKTDSSEGYQLP